MANKCRVVNLRKDSYDVYIGRPSPFGNPYGVDKYGRETCIELYRSYFTERISKDSEFRELVQKLSGKTLGCFCKPSACHGDIIAAYVNGNQDKQIKLFFMTRRLDERKHETSTLTSPAPAAQVDEAAARYEPHPGGRRQPVVATSGAFSAELERALAERLGR